MCAEDNIEKTKDVPAAYEKLSDPPFCGMWKDREDMKDPAAYVHKIRQPRYYWDDVLGVVRSDQS